MTKPFEITLKPTDSYFFGGERTFDEGEQANYSAESNLFPQQTALLGLVRYLILEQCGALPLPIHRNKANVLIGSKSFVASEEAQDFGMIQQLGPLLMKKGDEYFRVTNSKEELSLDFNTNATLWTGSGSAAIPIVADYDPKAHYPIKLVSLADGRSVDLEEVLETHEQVGIRKTTDGSDNTDGFFKQTCYGLRPGYQFVFQILTTAGQYEQTTYELQEQEGYVSFGGEQKQFSYRIARSEQLLSESWKQPDGSATSSRLVTVSDSWVDQKLYDHCEFSLAETTSFRTVSYDHHFRKSKPTRLNLLKKGSVLYPRKGQLSDLASYLEQPSKFRMAGFNHYLYLS